MKPLYDEAIKRAAAEALDLIDTIVGSDGLEIHRSKLFFLNRSYYVTCPEFGDFYVKVRVDRHGVPKKADVYIEE